jgi:hypothetical protein
LSNLALLCGRHHRAVHEDGFQIARLPNGELEFRRPDGRVLPEVPALPAVEGNREEALRGQNVSVELNAYTLRPSWGGEHLDLGYAIDVLHPRAIGH